MMKRSQSVRMPLGTYLFNGLFPNEAVGSCSLALPTQNRLLILVSLSKTHVKYCNLT